MGISRGQRVNGAGRITHAGRRWFVCGALADQQVRVERFDGKLLVSYRNMYIREIDLEHEITRPLVVARRSSEEAAPVALRAPSPASSEENTPPEPRSKL